MWDAAWHLMGNTLEIVHHIVFSSVGGMWGIKYGKTALQAFGIRSLRSQSCSSMDSRGKNRTSVIFGATAHSSLTTPAVTPGDFLILLEIRIDYIYCAIATHKH